ncbi:sporulation protein YpjB [Hazenella coriacea]|uniref:Sporulation protein YpjB n=1 Tax=Hazenella coriacea TaxID=1179467 RepID=A0A4R3L2F5_9BACL|nr:sporulation protein YpjB [Hazenella coriacea]TCS93372.1 sporulation protein YpjB [Hazenella coriacea]
MFTRVRGYLFLCSFLIYFLFQPITLASTDFQKESESWSRTANLVVKWIDKGDYLEAKTQLAILANQFSKSNLSDKNLSIEAIHELSNVILDLEHQLNRITPNEEEIRVSAIRLQVAFDAVSHPHQPLWKRYYDPMKKHIQHIKEAIVQKDLDSVQEAVKQLLDEYHMVRPALVITKSPSTVHKVDSLLTFIEKQTDLSKLDQGVKQLETLLQPLFFGTEKDVMAVTQEISGVSVQVFIFWVSSFIAGVLTYVSWTRYQVRMDE